MTKTLFLYLFAQVVVYSCNAVSCSLSRANRCLALLINLPLGIPVAISFEKYHHAHHRFMGDTNNEVDIPLSSEAKAFHSMLGKLFWLLIQPLTYSLRPLIKWLQKPSLWELVNLIAPLVFNWVVVSFSGWGFLVFLVLATLIGMSFHLFTNYSLLSYPLSANASVLNAISLIPRGANIGENMQVHFCSVMTPVLVCSSMARGWILRIQQSQCSL